MTAPFTEYHYINHNSAVTRLTEAMRYQPEDRGFDFQWRLSGFFRPQCGTGVDSASDINYYQYLHWGVKVAGARGSPYHLHLPIV